MYPNVILEKPIVTCEPERILVQIQTSKSGPSYIYAEDHIADPNCTSRNTNHLILPLGNCGMIVKKTKNPASIIYRICISVQLHPFFITDSDRSYCAQCVYLDTDVIDDLQQSLSVSDSAPYDLEPQYDQVLPKCSYQIRRNSIEGPLIHYALLGETVYHVWKCYGENFQILVQNCYVEDGAGNHILIIRSDGCSVDQYILETPIYSLDRRTASQEMHVFKFAGKAITRFTCQIRICSLSNDSCQISAPYIQCPKNEEKKEPTSAFVQDSSIITSAPQEMLAKTTIITATGKDSWNLLTGKLDLITSPEYSESVTATTKTPEVEQTFVVSETDDYGFDLESNSAFPPSIQPSSRSHEEVEIEEPSIYERRVKWNFLTNRPTKRNVSLKPSKSSKDHFPPYDVSGVITILESPDDVAYLESKYPSAGRRRDTALRGIATNASHRPLMKCMPQIVFLTLVGIIALSVILMSIIIPYFTKCRHRNATFTSPIKINRLRHQINN
uniref:ZP domain-containing protein n=1 Tax=Elaeophora elaphi TaxID=1147741 RepID=A0A0R3S241_9BILA